MKTYLLNAFTDIAVICVPQNFREMFETSLTSGTFIVVFTEYDKEHVIMITLLPARVERHLNNYLMTSSVELQSLKAVQVIFVLIKWRN